MFSLESSNLSGKEKGKPQSETFLNKGRFCR